MRDKKQINNMRDGHHLNSTYWQNWKKSLPMLNYAQFQLVLGLVLSDASMYRVSLEALVKFEQGLDQKPFLDHLFSVMSGYCFMIQPGTRYHLRGPNKGKVKSYWFKTFSHTTFSYIWFYGSNGLKIIMPGLVRDHLTALGLAYWVMGDGSLDRGARVLTLHTQGFTKEENETLSSELNAKFSLHSNVIPHKQKYWVIQFPVKDANTLHTLLKPHMIPSMQYKVPRFI